MKKMILIAWLPTTGKSTLANKMVKYGYTIVSLDDIYTDFIKEERPRLFGMRSVKENFYTKMIQHIWDLKQEVLDKFYDRVLRTINKTDWDIVVEWWHLDLFLHKIKMYYHSKYIITDIMMKEWHHALVQQGMYVDRDDIEQELTK